jgi:uncharacterized protein (DUF885 family)
LRVVAEIERYLVMPGQVLAYKVGMNTLLAAARPPARPPASARTHARTQRSVRALISRPFTT